MKTSTERVLRSHWGRDAKSPNLLALSASKLKLEVTASAAAGEIELVEFALLKAYPLTRRLEEARQLVDRSRGPRGIPVAGLEVLALS